MTEIWGTHVLPENEFAAFALGPLQFWCKRTGSDFWLAHRHADGSKAKIRKAPSEEIEWLRWALQKPAEQVYFSPALPDLPLLVKPEYSFQVMSKAETRIYVSIPLWVRIEHVYKQRTQIVEIPTIILSKTWFGGRTDGEICYGITSRARRELGGKPVAANLLTCPVHILNRAHSDLKVEKLILRGRRLSVFRDARGFWSDEVRIEYQGGDDGSHITISGKKPPEAEKATLVTPPRNPDRRGFVAKTFSTFKDITGLDSLF